MKIYRCQYCNFNVIVNKNNSGTKSAKYKMGNHYETIHKDLLPPDMTGYQWFYFILTKKVNGSCVVCKNNTEFNEVTMKYCRYCTNPACKQKYKEERDKRMMGKHGKLYLTNDVNHQKKMLAARKISGDYLWSDKSARIGYTGSYELDFLKYIDSIGWKSSDIMGPSPHTYVYEYEKKQHFYIPDYFIPSLSLEVEIKDDGSARNINQDSRNKDKIKDELMRSLSNLFNYIRIVNKDYTEFIELIKEEK